MIQPIPTREDFEALLCAHLDRKHVSEILEIADFTLRDPWFWTFPAAPSAPDKPAKHHGGRGGLATHTLEVLTFALGTASAYPPSRIDRYHLALGAILHDCGKLAEYSHHVIDGVEYWKRATPMISHIMHGLQMWAHAWGGNWTDKTFETVTHMIASHHGRREWGSPVVPATLEAYILHAADVQSLLLSGADNPEYRKP